MDIAKVMTFAMKRNGNLEDIKDVQPLEELSCTTCSKTKKTTLSCLLCLIELFYILLIGQDRMKQVCDSFIESVMLLFPDFLRLLTLWRRLPAPSAVQ